MSQCVMINISFTQFGQILSKVTCLYKNEDRLCDFACFSVIDTRHIVDCFTGGRQEGGVQVLLISKLVAMFCIGNYRWCRCLLVCSSSILRYRVFVSGPLL